MGLKIRKSDLLLFFTLLLAVAFRPLAVCAQDIRLAAGAPPTHHQAGGLHLKALGETQGSPKDLFHFLKSSKDQPGPMALGHGPARQGPASLVPVDAAPCPAGGPVRCPLALRI